MLVKVTRCTFYFAALMGSLFTAQGQNLILNASFEEYKECPSNISSFDALLDNVSLPTSSSGDYFNTCASGDFNTDNNFKGGQEPADGKGYAGLYYYALNDYREYLQLDAARTLRAKHPHKLSFKVSLAEASTIALKNMSLVMTSKKIRVPNSKVLTASRLDLQPDIQLHEVPLKANGSLSETDGWVTLTAEFDAKGFENHFLIGNFKENKATELLRPTKAVTSSDFSYYFVDAFELEELPRINYEKDKIYVLERKPFEPKGYDLDDEAVAQVKKIFKFLKENADVQMKITGHSDDVGNAEYNKFVSSLRARAVALYLKKLGVEDDRIVWEGVGNSKPLRNGKVKDERLRNRRVEFVMTDVKE
ncbi:OmpA-like periplasmic protein [Croceitalea dokdonensis DOKDO 023]|uniref:OmpA-like periplasmic protein n=1 Tax=Croceitalea dokdonensis DOKDO 023 TaxID=1300341 RepID=A0A0N8H3H9_9FLAO|nr:OmpA family protein [Croceitalea dokdonensis]KPM30620.1 OmpA-like periplasmic protein [Croceitalea dokdonensis DOKDO 023]